LNSSLAASLVSIIRRWLTTSAGLGIQASAGSCRRRGLSPGSGSPDVLRHVQGAPQKRSD
jgi:hypothetical protein